MSCGVLQVTDVADAMILRVLFSTMFQMGAVLVATSNRKPDDLYLGGINRTVFLPFIDVLKTQCTVHQMVSIYTSTT
jgi:predicted ATPase